MNYLSKSSLETEKIGENLGKEIAENKISKKIILLFGDLGSGKTTFLKGFASGLNIREKILSPTFIIFRKMKIPKKKGHFFHFDCYRIRDKKELKDLGFEKIIDNKENVVAIEWPNIIKNSFKKDAICINFKFINENKRRISIKNNF